MLAPDNSVFFSLDASVRLLSLQFCFTNICVVPDSVRELEAETLAERQQRLYRQGSGKLIIGPAENCSLTDFLSDFKHCFRIVDAFYQPRIDAKDPRGRRIYHTVRFSYAPSGIPSVLENHEPNLEKNLCKMCEEAFWRARVFLNPYWKKGREIRDQYALMVQLDGRQPLFRNDGQPVKIWEKDKWGERIGKATVVMAPDYRLRMEKGVIRLINK